MEREAPVAILKEPRETGRDTVEYAQRASSGNMFSASWVSLAFLVFEEKY